MNCLLNVPAGGLSTMVCCRHCVIVRPNILTRRKVTIGSLLARSRCLSCLRGLPERGRFLSSSSPGGFVTGVNTRTVCSLLIHLSLSGLSCRLHSDTGTSATRRHGARSLGHLRIIRSFHADHNHGGPR